MREIAGDIIIPSDCPIITGAAVLIEVRDVARADALSTVVAQTKLANVNFGPGDRIPFSLNVPEVSEAYTLDMRVHISRSGNTAVKSGDLLTTRSYQVPNRGILKHMSVFVQSI